MALLIMGKFMIISFMALTMGIPFAYFMKRDRAYAATEGQSQELRNKVWYDE